MIKLQEITKKTDQELAEFITAERAALAKAIIDSRTKEVKGVKILSGHKKTIARGMTIARERAIAKMEASEMIRTLRGTVVSDKMDKTVVVAVNSVKEHPIYRKKYKVTTKFKAHDENNEIHTGDLVEITETRPISRDKRWVVARKVNLGEMEA